MQKRYQICKRCVMDTSDPDIEFDENGVCNHCRGYDEIVKKNIIPISKRKVELERIISKIKEDGKGKKYDCIVGLSGGVDSSYVAYLAKEFNLKPLTVHINNGWNSEIAEKNIKNIVNKLGFDIFTYKADWEEFKDLQRSYFKASVIDIEVLTDNVIFSYIYNLALRKNIKYQLYGMNIATESIMPKSWNYNKTDVRNIIAIQKRFGTREIKNISFISTLQCKWNDLISKKINKINILNYIDYDKTKAKGILKEKLEWEDYGGKHYESIFTRFYQAYILPKKFRIDKRRAHLSNLIYSEQVTRKEALEELKKDPYPLQLLEKDKKYLLNKLDFSKEEFEIIMREKPKSHLEYPNERKMINFLTFIYRYVKPFLK